jgi:arginyl-tRNA synthetase
VITQDVRRAIARALAAEGFAPADPGLRPGGRPGCYASSVAFGLAGGRAPRDIARLLAARLAAVPWLASAEVSGPGFLALTVTAETLAALPGRIAAVGPACARSDVLSGVTVEAPPTVALLAADSRGESPPAATLPAADGRGESPPAVALPAVGREAEAPPAAGPLPAVGWEEARAALAAELTARLAAAAGATVASSSYPERSGPSPPGHWHFSGDVAAAVGFAGIDAVRFSLAAAVPGRPVRIDGAQIARHLPGNPAYAVRYAHARAASGVRWAATLAAEAGPRCLPADPGELALLDALSWLPERVAVAARRGRPDEYARYLEELASVTIATLSSPRDPGSAGAPGTDRLAVAGAARTGLAAGLGLIGVSAPDRL